MKLSASSQKFNSWKPYKSSIWVGWVKGKLSVLTLGLACKSMSLGFGMCDLPRYGTKKNLQSLIKIHFTKQKKNLQSLIKLHFTKPKKKLAKSNKTSLHEACKWSREEIKHYILWMNFQQRMKTTNKSLPRNPDILLNKNKIFSSNLVAW